MQGETTGTTATLREQLPHPNENFANAGVWGRREAPVAAHDLYIYVVPLVQGDYVFLPVAAPKHARTGWKGTVEEKVSRSKEKLHKKWTDMGNSDPKSFKRKVHRFVTRHIEDVSPEERLVQGVPKGISKVVVVHPSSVQSQQVVHSLTSIARNTRGAELTRTIGFACLTPCAQVVDFFVIPGPGVLTILCLWKTYSHAKGAIGSKRLTSLLTSPSTSNQHDNQRPEEYTHTAPGASVAANAYGPTTAAYPVQAHASGLTMQADQAYTTGQSTAGFHAPGTAPHGAPNVKGMAMPTLPADVVNSPGMISGHAQQGQHASRDGSGGAEITFVSSAVLEEAVRVLDGSVDGMLSETQVVEMCSALGAPALVERLLMLRRRRLRKLKVLKD